jgi:hypothetical protein
MAAAAAAVLWMDMQIRRSSYHEVVRVAELKPLADVSLVQTYVINADRVLFLNPRPRAPQHFSKCVGPAGACEECGRGLVDAAFRFCSLGCKVYLPTSIALALSISVRTAVLCCVVRQGTTWMVWIAPDFGWTDTDPSSVDFFFGCCAAT